MTRIEIPDEKVESKWWKPTIGATIEGELLGTVKGEFQGRETMNYVLLTPNGKEVNLPSHAHLEVKMGKVKPGNYVWISCIGEKVIKTGSHPMKVYKVEFDADHVPKPSLNTPDVGMHQTDAIAKNATETSKNASGEEIDQKNKLFYQLSEAIKMMAITGTPCTAAIVMKLADNISHGNAVELITHAKEAGYILQGQDGIYKGTA